MANKGLDPRKVASLMYNPQSLLASIEQWEMEILKEQWVKLKEDLEQLNKLLRIVIKYDRFGELGKKIDAILAKKPERVGYHNSGQVILVYNPKGLTGKRIDKIMPVPLPNTKNRGLAPLFRDADDKGVNEVERDEDDAPIRFHCPVAQAEYKARYLAAKKRLGII